MKATIEQIQKIVLKNPNKELIKRGTAIADKLMLHVHGVGIESAVKRCDHFENEQIYETRKQYAISNRDLFGRLLAQEDMIFAARGGSSNFHLSEGEERQMNGLLENVRYELSLRKWMRNFALQAYRCDPMGIIFMEIEQLSVNEQGQMNDPRPYPTYKSIYSIYDYQPTGRKLEYVCFQLCIADALSFGIEDKDFEGKKGEVKTDYFRFVDDEKDVIVKKVKSQYDEKESVIIATNLTKNPIKNEWGKTPGFIVSDLIQFDNPQVFISPLSPVVELADSFLYDRSIRDLQKKYHGFAKAIEPLLKCATCAGDGVVSGHGCPDCTPHGATKGTGYKLRTKVADVAKFPLEILEGTGFDWRNIFGYVTPDIQGWNKQDTSLQELENLIHQTYWGASNQLYQMQTKQPREQKTATEVSMSNKPKEARLNITADWAEKTESMIADFIGQFWFTASRKSSISYSRNYILETAEDFLSTYQQMRKDGLSETALDEALLRYYSALYQSNPTQLAICRKLMVIGPFVHLTVRDAKDVVENETDYLKKLYFGDWRRNLSTEELLTKSIDALDASLEDFVGDKLEGVKKSREQKQSSQLKVA